MTYDIITYANIKNIVSKLHPDYKIGKNVPEYINKLVIGYFFKKFKQNTLINYNLDDLKSLLPGNNECINNIHYEGLKSVNHKLDVIISKNIFDIIIFFNKNKERIILTDENMLYIIGIIENIIFEIIDVSGIFLKKLKKKVFKCEIIEEAMCNDIELLNDLLKI